MGRRGSSQMDEYLCLHCGRSWTAAVVAYKDWKRRKCAGCGKRRTVKKALFERAVEELAESLRRSPPPYPPQLSAVSAVFTLLADTFPDSSQVKVLWDAYQAARKRAGERADPLKES